VIQRTIGYIIVCREIQFSLIPIALKLELIVAALMGHSQQNIRHFEIYCSNISSSVLGSFFKEKAGCSCPADSLFYCIISLAWLQVI
jgi:hypothetical protein